MKRILLVYSLIVWIIPSGMQAQVTVGSGIAPNSACLLELKTNEIKDPVSVTDATNITSTAGGLGLSRVQLVNLTTLEPFIPNDTDWNSNKDKIKERHAGLTVYNIKVSDAAETDPNKVFQQGIYIWNGSSWKKEGADVWGNSIVHHLAKTNVYEEFYSARFGTAGRWMITNLSAKAYAGITHPYRNLQGPAANSRGTLNTAYWCYPSGISSTSSAEYDINPH
ncbi:hypothetical protein [Dysgonomonas reticulitermitis]